MPVRFNTSGGSGIDTSELTAERVHVLQDKIFYGCESDEPQRGGMPNISFRTLDREGSTARVVNIDNFTIASAGYCADVTFESAYIGYINATRFVHAVYGIHPDCVKYGQAIGANPAGGGFHATGNFTGDANISSEDVRRGKIAYSKGQKIIGNMKEIGMISYRPTTVSQFIESEQFISGQLEIQGDKNLIAANIKKGVTIFGVTGTWEGYVPTVNDLYLRGNQLVPWRAISSATFEAEQITISSNGGKIGTSNPVNLVGKRQLHVQYSSIGIEPSVSALAAWANYGQPGSIHMGNHFEVEGEQVATFDLSNAQVNQKIQLNFNAIGKRYIKRIWLS